MKAIAVDREKPSLLKFAGEIGAKRTLPAWIILAALLVVASATSKFFLQADNLANILRQSVALGIVSIGQTYVILITGIDLSVGPTISLVAVMSTGMMAGREHMILPAVICMLLLGLAIGLLNGLVVTVLKVPDFLATLGTMYILAGAALAYSPKPGGLVAPSFAAIATATWGRLPSCVFGLAFLFILAMLILNKTSLGRYMYAVGGDAEVARLSGIKVGRIKLVAYLICGFAAALSGLFVASLTTIGDPTVGTGFSLSSIAAVVIGGTSLFGGRGGLGGTALGVLIMAVLANTMNLDNVGGYTQLIVKGAIIILVVSSYQRKRTLEVG